jgi:hypothetical protein
LIRGKMKNFEASSCEYFTPEVKELGVIEEVVARQEVGVVQDSLLTSAS